MAGAAERRMPQLLVGRDIDDFRTKAGIERAVIDTLRKLGLLPPERPKPSGLHIVKDDASQ